MIPPVLKSKPKQKRRRFLSLYRREQGWPDGIEYARCANRNVMHNTSYITKLYLSF